MSFVDPVLLLGLALIPIGVLVARAISRRRRAAIVLLAGRPASIRRRRPVIEVIPGALVVAAFLALATAAARPVATVAIPRLEGTLMLTIDVSASMSATDADPTRLDQAKTVARAIVEWRTEGVLIGIVAFSNGGFSTQLPTDDTAALLAAIDRLAPTTGTSVGGGIIAALQTIESTKTSASTGDPTTGPADESMPPVALGSDGDALIVVLSDGESNAEPDPEEAAQQAADAGVRIVTIGVGTASGTTLELDGYRVFSALDEDVLRSVAATTEGKYIPAADEAAATTPYDMLGTSLVVREERLEVTALVAAVGLLLLIGATALSLARTGRLP